MNTKVAVQDVSHERWSELLEGSAREVFQIMLGSELERLDDNSETVPLECTAMVGLAGRLCGAVSFRCHIGSANTAACKMLALEAAESNEQAMDAIGEVCNMIAGTFKNKIAGSEPCVLSAPTVLMGGNYRVRSLAAVSLQKVFKFEGAPVEVSLQLRA